MSCGVDSRLRSGITVAMGIGLAAATPIQPLAWELLYDASVTLKRKKKV